MNTIMVLYHSCSTHARHLLIGVWLITLQVETHTLVASSIETFILLRNHNASYFCFIVICPWWTDKWVSSCRSPILIGFLFSFWQHSWVFYPGLELLSILTIDIATETVRSSRQVSANVHLHAVSSTITCQWLSSQSFKLVWRAFYLRILATPTFISYYFQIYSVLLFILF